MLFSRLAFSCALALGVAQSQTSPESVIHSFADFPYGANPYGTLVRAPNGNLFGTAYEGGAAYLGLVFRLDPAGHYKLLHSFQGGADGANPYAGVILGPDGNLYGTTYRGGPSNAGVVYKLSPSGTETVLYSFTGGADGGFPYAGVVADSAGNLYGATSAGGITGPRCYSHGCGVVFKVDSSGHETVLYSFTGEADGGAPRAGVVADPAGNLYGTTVSGGKSGRNGDCGVVYKLDTSNHESVLYTFACGVDGVDPAGGVILDSAGNLYGTTKEGGSNNQGTIYKLDPSGNHTVLYSFNPAGSPYGGLTRDPSGNLYGSTQYGGTANNGMVFKLDTTGTFTTLYSFPLGATFGLDYPNSPVVLDPTGNIYGVTSASNAPAEGLVYQLDPAGAETTLYSFAPAPGGTRLYSGLTRDPSGNFYGTTNAGGTSNAGVVYKIDPAGHQTVLYSFTGGVDGGYPESGVIRDSAGNLYGTTGSGGPAGCCGVVYKLDPSGNQTVLYTFTGGADGADPVAGLVADSAGNLYGTAEGGGLADCFLGEGCGVVYKIDPSGHETVLYSFTGAADGSNPVSGVTFDSARNIYGTTLGGGVDFGGVVYKLDPDGHETPLYSFTALGNGGGGPTGAYPYGGVVLDPEGNVYGTAWAGGDMTGPFAGCSGYGCGVVFKIDTSGQFSLLYLFTGGADGGMPNATMVRDSAGNLYGTTDNGGSNAICPDGLYLNDSGCGVVFKLNPSGHETVLYRFTGPDGSAPYAGVILDSNGFLYGTTLVGGPAGAGVVYKLTLP